MRPTLAILTVLVATLTPAHAAPPPDARCASHRETRQPFFGDLHVHTTYSQDASTQGTRTTPREAYRFARGETLGIQPWDADGRPLRTVQLTRPLDFAAVTDHAEQLGEVHLCRTPGAPGYDGWVCRMYRGWPRAAFYVMNARYVFDSRWGFCGEDAVHCLEAAGTVWRDIQAAAEEATDRSDACRFTAFVAYEWTAGPSAAHLHRNVVFASDAVPALPISKMETGTSAIELWRQLERECQGDCDVVTIPHNSNLGGGYTFTSAETLGEAIGDAEIALRSRYDRLVEVMQHKGDSECALVGDMTDEACGFESTPRASPLPFSGSPELAPVDFARDALKQGLALRARFGANPLQFGLVASTDTHLGAAGLTAERGHPGHGGAGKPARDALPVGLPDDLGYNPGGLAVLWAEENTRASLFAAMQRREAYGTSGTRPTLRFFAGAGIDEASCDADDPAAAGYAGGVPMGGVLDAAAAAHTPRFLVSGLRDPHPSAAPLDRIEIVKGWRDGDVLRERVVSVVGGHDASVDTNSCERRGDGAEALCAVWQDPDFDPAADAFYYARLLETPSCRWSQWACLDAGVDCSDPSTIGEGFEACCAEDHVKTIQERAWSSPIWIEP